MEQQIPTRTPPPQCNAEELAMKSFFLGPQAENKEVLEDCLQRVMSKWLSWRTLRFPADGQCISREDQTHPAFLEKFKQLGAAMDTVSYHLQKEIPKHSPRYIGHMFSEYSIPGLLGHLMAVLYNPNNISKESSKVGVWLEREAIKALSQMVGYPDHSRGHFTSGGTVANFEMLYRAKQLWKQNLIATHSLPVALLEESDFGFMQKIQVRLDRPLKPPVLIVPESAHYSWKKGAALLGIGGNQLMRIPLDHQGRMRVDVLTETIDRCYKEEVPILAVVSVLGTTELGVTDAIDKIAETLSSFHKATGLSIWHHIDAAYGGFFCSLRGGSKIPPKHHNLMQALHACAHSDSITIDPHKLGYVPYASGCVIIKDPGKYRIVSTTAPYVAFDALEDPGPFTLEGSRSAAGAISTYLTAETIRFDAEGMGRILSRTMASTESLRERLTGFASEFLIPEYDLTNILCFSVKGSSSKLSHVNIATQKTLQALEEHNRSCPSRAFYVSQTTLQQGHQEMISAFCEKYGLQNDCDALVLIRCTVMNPFVTSMNSDVDYLQEFCDLLRSKVRPATEVAIHPGEVQNV